MTKLNSRYRVVRTYPSRLLIKEEYLSKEAAQNRAAIENLGSDTEVFSVEEVAGVE